MPKETNTSVENAPVCKVCSHPEGKKDRNPAWVVALHMGLGHIRAAFPLRDIAHGGIVLYGTKDTCDDRELKTWKRMLSIYYFFSNARRIPIIGSILHALFEKVEKIKPVYPRIYSTRPDLPTYTISNFIKGGLCRNLMELITAHRLPVVSTYFATGLAIDMIDRGFRNYIVVTDTDIARSWAPLDPLNSQIIYCSPSMHATRRLISYGVRPENIRQTGFPLPKENIGTEKNAEILKEDLYRRLTRLDPKGTFYHRMKDTVKLRLHKNLPIPHPHKKDPFTIMFAVGGAGAQFEMVEAMLPALKGMIRKGEVRYLLSCGANAHVANRFKETVHKNGMNDLFGSSIDVIYDHNVLKYFEMFNAAIRNVDIIWSKPSELVFYAGLAIPILCAPPIGPHEHLNRNWVVDMGAGVTMPADASSCDQWIPDLIEEGRFANAAWNGFINAPRNGTYNIEKLVKTGKM